MPDRYKRAAMAIVVQLPSTEGECLAVLDECEKLVRYMFRQGREVLDDLPEPVETPVVRLVRPAGG